MAMAGIKKEKEKLMWEFLVKARPFMTAHDKDGVGYAALGPKGIWGERWRNPEEAWLKDSRKVFSKKDSELQSKFNGNLESDIRYSEIGTGGTGQGNSAVIYHSRFATCDKTMDNVHPFVRGTTALIHNGVIRNAEELQMLKSTCDSETILNEYCDLNVTNDPDKIQEMVKKLYGYFGCALLTMDDNGKRYLDIFRHTANIYATFVDELGVAVYCTSDDILKLSCKEMKFNYGHIFKIKENVLIRLDAVTGLPVLFRKFDANEGHYTTKNFNHYGGPGGSANVGKTQTSDSTTNTKSGSQEAGEELDERDVLGLSEKKSLAIVPSSYQISEQEKLETTRSQESKSQNSSNNASEDRSTCFDDKWKICD